MLKHEDWPGLEKISTLRTFEEDGSMRHISILCGNGGLFLDFETERGADGAMTGFGVREVEFLDPINAVAFVPETHGFMCGGFGDIHRPTVRRRRPVGRLWLDRREFVEIISADHRFVRIGNHDLDINLVWCRAVDVRDVCGIAVWRGERITNAGGKHLRLCENAVEGGR